jgi:hypothetical protein
MYYSPTTKGFYDPEINTDIPSDKVSLTDQQYQELMVAQSEGKVISVVNGQLFSSDPAPVTKTDAEWNAAIDAQLMAADWKIIRALTEGDTARINAHKAAQATLRATRR